MYFTVFIIALALRIIDYIDTALRNHKKIAAITVHNLFNFIVFYCDQPYTNERSWVVCVCIRFLDFTPARYRRPVAHNFTLDVIYADLIRIDG